MAEVLSVEQLLANTAEPKRVFRWILALEGIDAFTAQTAGKPTGTFGEEDIQYINTIRYIAGKWKPAELSITLWDPIAPSASQKVMDWVRLNYETQTGRAGYFETYSKDFDLKMLDPVGGVAEQWSIKGAWPKAITYSGLDYTSDDVMTVSMTIRFNSAILLF